MIKTQKIDYQSGSTVLEGYCAFDDSGAKKKPAVLIVHDNSGKNDFACKKAEKLAELGYLGFAVDIYGKGVLAKTNDEKMALMKPFLEDRSLILQRMLAAYELVKKMENTDTSKMAAMGYCFGGLCSLDLARS